MEIRYKASEAGTEIGRRLGPRSGDPICYISKDNGCDNSENGNDNFP